MLRAALLSILMAQGTPEEPNADLTSAQVQQILMQSNIHIRSGERFDAAGRHGDALREFMSAIAKIKAIPYDCPAKGLLVHLESRAEAALIQEQARQRGCKIDKPWTFLQQALIEIGTACMRALREFNEADYAAAEERIHRLIKRIMLLERERATSPHSRSERPSKDGQRPKAGGQ